MATQPPDEMIGERTETFRVPAEIAERAAREVARPDAAEGFVGFLVNYTQRSDLRIEIEGSVPDDVLNIAERAEGAGVVVVPEEEE